MSAMAEAAPPAAAAAAAADQARIFEWIQQLVLGPGKDTALLELSKKREQLEDLAIILWHSYGKRSPDDD